MGIEICEALRQLEREGIVCGDISPDTVCRTEKGGYALTGLGLRRALQKAGTALYGTICRDYDAPEVRDGAPATARSDVYSLALLMKEMMEGSGENACAAALQTVLDRALCPAPEDRYAGGQEMQQALQACLPSVPAAAEPERKKETTPAGTTPETKKKRTRLAVMAAVLAAALLAVTVGALLLRPEKKPQEAPPAADLEEVGAYLQESRLPAAEGPATAESTPGATAAATAPSLPPSLQPTPPASPEGTPEPAEPDGPAPEPETSGEPENVSACILPTDTERISYEDLAGMSDMETYMVINEIYARHGKIFTTESIQEYFEQQDWYTPETRDSQTVVSRFSDLEMANLSTVVQYQREMGYR